MAELLWRKDDAADWPALSFATLREEVAKMQGYAVSATTIRSTVYQRTDVFEKVTSEDGSVRWRLTKAARAKRT